MGIFSDLRAARRENRELGQGVWRRAHDRFERGLDRFHQVLEGIESDELYNALVEVANDLADLREPVRAVCVRGQRLRPSEGTDIPAGADVAHRALSRAANDVAQAAQAAAMARLELEGGAGVPAGADGSALGAAVREEPAVINVRRRAEAVREGVRQATAAARRL